MNNYKNQAPPKPVRITEQMQDTALATIGDRAIGKFAPNQNTIIAYSARLASMLTYRGSDKLSNDERFALAAAALTYDLNPALYEIWYVAGFGLMVGWKGWTKKLNELAERLGFTWWPEYERLRPDEYKAHGIPADAATAWKCGIRRSDTNRAYLEMLTGLQNSGIKFDADFIIQYAGKPPVTEGIGYITKKEYDGKPDQYDSSKTYGGLKDSGMNIEERCQKRAFTAACRKMIHIPLGSVPDTVVVNGQFVAADSWQDEEEFSIPIEATYSEPVEVSRNLYPDENFEGFGDAPTKTQSKPAAPDLAPRTAMIRSETINWFADKVKEFEQRGDSARAALSDKDHRSLMIDMKSLDFKNNDERHAFCEITLGSTSTRDFTMADRWAIGAFAKRPTAAVEVRAVLDDDFQGFE